MERLQCCEKSEYVACSAYREGVFEDGLEVVRPNCL